VCTFVQTKNLKNLENLYDAHIIVGTREISCPAWLVQPQLEGAKVCNQNIPSM
jgi:hypothetical protein